MKNYIYLFIFTLIIFSCKKEENQTLPLHNKKVLILGNSITQNGKYVDFLEYYLRKNHPQKTLDIISIGLSSETASGDSEANHPYPRPCIHSRLDNALKLIKPDVVLACYGMNDGVFSNFDETRFENYKMGILDLMRNVENTGAQIIFLTPTPFDPDPIKDRISFDDEPHSYKNPYFNYGGVLADYSNWLMDLGATKVINLNSYLNEELVAIKTQKSDSTFIPDGVHPNEIGHFYMAKKILADLYPKISIDDVVSETTQLKKDTAYVMISKRRKIRSDGWLKYIGYTRGETVKSDAIEPTKEKVKQLDIAIEETLNYTQ
ncbi:SGNH/GDSL hydrolase family protein [Algibacter sp. 2305UL17-15]|uniref:SGNH/GDSL hydrolase family protein n=1 Tax=Algibacter sp. 2305UL17-15 TaxID=3231268 RepID=UPI0034576F80